MKTIATIITVFITFLLFQSCSTDDIETQPRMDMPNDEVNHALMSKDTITTTPGANITTQEIDPPVRPPIRP
jgi:hypothetical protein